MAGDDLAEREMRWLEIRDRPDFLKRRIRQSLGFKAFESHLSDDYSPEAEAAHERRQLGSFGP